MPLREINTRKNNGLRVTLLWRTDNNTLVIKVDDESDPDKNVTIENVPPADAKRAFDHPYSYRRGMMALSTKTGLSLNEGAHTPPKKGKK